MQILTYYVVSGRLQAEDVVALNGAKTVKNSPPNRFEVRLNNPRVVKTDIDTTNGVIHVIDTVLIPEEAQQD